ncbi:MAG: KpsF/GutQ family sugar-phosphate isomerase [Candidatus Omnitrophica bacterium]|nr:KpsF/GutQ family sugar-phosphate isomerase [Candidatus Omnitrophota bacterium]
MSTATAKAVLKHEADSILRMAGRLDAGFDKTVRMIVASRHPVILVGMGKPGFIAEKISASFASTGTPSFTLHPADALHGDIGRVPSGAVLILLSNSGETEELTRLAPLLKSIGAKIVVMTGNMRSSLARFAEVVLDTSVVSEAEPLNLAPTASTTCMLAMGDALAMALVKKRKFKEKDFALLHPGGMLGKRMRLKVKDVMRSGDRNPRVKPTDSIREVLLRITTARAGSAAVVNAKGCCLGIFTDGDLRRHFKELTANPNTPVSRFMTSNPVTVSEDMLAVRALELLRRRAIDELPVTDAKGRVSGLLDVQDLLAQGFIAS